MKTRSSMKLIMFLAMAVVSAGCSDGGPDPVSPGNGEPSFAEGTIGPSGGSVVIDNEIALFVSAGALTTDVHFTLEENTSPEASSTPMSFVSPAYSIGPAGTAFNDTATVTIFYDLGLTRVIEGRVSVCRDDGSGWEQLQTIVDTCANTASTGTTHLSDFAAMADTAAVVIRVCPDGSGDFPTIQAAIDAASDGDVVELSDGTFTGDGNRAIDCMGRAIEVCSESGDPAACIIDCEGQARGMFFHSDEDARTIVRSITITNGSADYGGGMRLSGACPMLVDCVLQSNIASEKGGGIYCSNSSSPAMSRCTFTGNEATLGGGLCCVNSSSPDMAGCTFTGNEASRGGGLHCTDLSCATLNGCDFVGNRSEERAGALYCASALTLVDCTFEENESDRAGGMHCQSSSPALLRCTFVGNRARMYGGGLYCYDSSPTLEDCRFEGNVVEVWDGGGIYCTNSSSPELVNCEFHQNSGRAASCIYSSDASFEYCLFQENDGGAVHCYESSPLLSGCVFVGNSGWRGAGVDCYRSSPVFTLCAFLANSVETSGGAISCVTASSPSLVGCTLADNEAGTYGGGLSLEHSSASITNTIIAFSVAGGAVHQEGTGGSTLTCCDVFGNSGGDWTGSIADQLGTSDNFSADPLFCGEGNTGEPYSLHDGSPCLPENSPCGELVGAFAQGCGRMPPVEGAGWGAIKAMCR